MVPLDKSLVSSPPETGVNATWIGHATVMAQFDNITVLTDPIFSTRCGPKHVNGFMGRFLHTEWGLLPNDIFTHLLLFTTLPSSYVSLTVLHALIISYHTM